MQEANAPSCYSQGGVVDGIPLQPLSGPQTRPGRQREIDQVITSSLPPTDGRQAWLFLACASTLEAVIWGLANSYGAFQNYHLSSTQSPLYGKDASTISSAIGSIILAGNYFTPWLFSSLFHTYPHRIRLFAWIGLGVSSIGLIVASFDPTSTKLIILQGFFSWGSSVFYMPAILWLPDWFDAKRGLATGTMLMGAGIGGVIWPFILSGLLNHVGFAWTLRCLCLVQLLLGTMIAFFMKSRLPLSRPSSSSSTLVRSRRRGGFLQTFLPKHNVGLNSFLGVTSIILQFLHAAAFRSISYYISPYATSLGLSNFLSTMVLASLNAASAISYVLTGKLCDVLPYGIIILFVNLVGTLLVSTLLGFATSFNLVLCFTIFYGLTMGGMSTTMSPMARQVAQSTSSNSSPIFLEYLACRGAGGLLGPLISASLYKGSSSTVSKSIWSAKAIYGSHGLGPVVIFVTIISGINSLLSFTIVNFRHRRRT